MATAVDFEALARQLGGTTRTQAEVDQERERAAAAAVTAAREAARIPPEVQAQRDQGAISILRQEEAKAERRAAAGDPRAQADLEAVRREVSRVQGVTAPAPSGMQPSLATSRGVRADMPAAAPVAARQAPPQDIGALAQQLGGQTAPTAPQQPGFLASVLDPITGALRATQETRTLPEWTSMPELNQMSVASFKSALGTMMSSPRETVQILRTNFPNMGVRQDSAGNFILRSSVDGKEYAIPPGFSMGDIPRALGSLFAFTPAGAARTIPGAIAGAAGTQAGIEATQAATGGEFSPGEVAVAGALGPVGQIVQRGSAALRGGAPRAPTPMAAVPEERIEPSFEIELPAQPPAQPTPRATAPATPEITVEGGAVPTGAIPAPFEATIAPGSVSDVLTLARKAAGSGRGAASARAKLADVAQVNPEARDAAQRLGIDVPFDVLSDNPQVRSAVGLTRSLVGSAAESDWQRTVRNATRRSDDVMQQYDAIFIAGRPSTDAASQRVLDSLKATRDKLDADAGAIYKKIDGTPEVAGLVPKSTAVEMNNLRNTIAEIVGEVGEGGMTAQERKLSQMIEAGPVTYGRLIREKNLIGKAMQGQQSPYGDLDSATLKRLYGALAQDQLDNVGRIAGEDVRQQLRAANLMTAQRKGLEKRMVAGFGTELTGSIATKIQTALRSGAKGDATAFSELLKTVPKDLQRETLATALASVTASRRGTPAGGVAAEEAVFGFNDFVKTYRDLRANPTVYSKMAQVMGPEWDRSMRDLYEISKRVTDAQGRVLTTGKANQILGEASVQGLIGKVMNTSVAQRVAIEVAAKVPGGGLIAPDIINFMQSGNKQAVQKASDLFASPDFQKLATEAATTGGQVSRDALRRTAASGAFSRFATAAMLPRDIDSRVMWLQTALQSGRQFSQEPQQ